MAWRNSAKHHRAFGPDEDIFNLHGRISDRSGDHANPFFGGSRSFGRRHDEPDGADGELDSGDLGGAFDFSPFYDARTSWFDSTSWRGVGRRKNQDKTDDTGGTDPVDTGGTDPVDTGGTDPVDTGGTDPVDTGGTDPVDTGGTDPVDTGGTDPVDTGGTDPVDTGGTDPVDTGGTDPVDTGATDPVDTGGTDPVDTGGTEPLLLTNYVSGGEAEASYNIEIVFEGDWTGALQDAFVAAADYLSSLITGDLADYASSTGVIDDLRIDASLADIDGVGGVLGQAGPNAFRSSSFLPASGTMTFDSADAERYDDLGLFDDIVLHEMVHVLGFGTLFGLMGLTSGRVADDNLVFTGENANAAYQAEFGGTTLIPMETDGGAGTAGGHWDEAVFDDEIMTGVIDNSNYLSAMSVAALEDMGYETVWDASDPASIGVASDLFV